MRRLLTPGWLVAHVLLVVAVAVMLGLGWWQLTRATGGNTLSWGYAFQWPAFAGFAVFVWAREARKALRGEPSPMAAPVTSRLPVVTRARRAANPAYDDSDDPELAAYNRYLAWLSENPGARPMDYPG